MMLRNSFLFAAALVLACSFIISGGVSQAATNTGPTEMILKTTKAKKPALFPHKAHQDRLACAECHHTKGDDGKQVAYSEGMKIQKCVTCHNDTMTNTRLNGFKKAAHTRCKGCHKKVGPPAPTKCSGCHVKKKK